METGGSSKEYGDRSQEKGVGSREAGGSSKEQGVRQGGVVKSFKDLVAYQQAHAVVVSVYRLLKKFPVEEKYGLSDQMRRCSTSITSNITEGFNRFSLKEKVQFYSVALGSTAELQSQLMVARDVGYVAENTYDQLDGEIESVHKLIFGLVKSTRQRQKK